LNQNENFEEKSERRNTHISSFQNQDVHGWSKFEIDLFEGELVVGCGGVGMLGERDTEERECEKIQWWKNMIIVWSSFDQMAKIKLIHGGKVLDFPMLNAAVN